MVEIDIFSARNTTGIAINNMRVTKTKPYGLIQIMQKYVVDDKAIIEAIGADVQLVKRGEWVHDRGTQWKCSNCGNFLDFDGLNCGRGSAFFCPNCGARMDGDTNG